MDTGYIKSCLAIPRSIWDFHCGIVVLGENPTAALEQKPHSTAFCHLKQQLPQLWGMDWSQKVCRALQVSLLAEGTP